MVAIDTEPVNTLEEATQLVTKNPDAVEKAIETGEATANEVKLVAQALLLNNRSNREIKEETLESLQTDVLAKPYMQKHHKAWLLKETNKLVKAGDKKSLQHLKQRIDFTKKGGLILHTQQGTIKFKPNQATYNDVKGIKGIEEYIYTANEEANNVKGLWTNLDGFKLMKKAGKKIHTIKEQGAIDNMFLGEDFFDLLGVKQPGTRNALIHSRDGKRGNKRDRSLRVDKDEFAAKKDPRRLEGANVGYSIDESGLDSKSFGDEDYVGVWFLEDEDI